MEQIINTTEIRMSVSVYIGPYRLHTDFVNFCGYTGIVAVNVCVCTSVRSAGNEHSEYVRIASVLERIISKTLLHSS